MAIPFISHCPSVASQDRLQYLLQLQDERDKRTRSRGSEENSMSEGSDGLSPVLSASTASRQDSPLYKKRSRQRKHFVFGVLRKLHHVKSTEEHRNEGMRDSAEFDTADIEVTEMISFEDLGHLDSGDERSTTERNETRVYEFEDDEARPSRRTMHSVVNNHCQSEYPNLHLFPTPKSPRLEGFRIMEPQSPNYPATSLFQRCSELFTNPFAAEFSLDPTKLACPSALLSCALYARQTTTRSYPFRKVKILDVGGGFADSYIEILTSIPQLHVSKAIINSMTNFSYPQHGAANPARFSRSLPGLHESTVLLIDQPWTLPFPTQSLDIVVTRSLHKDIAQMTPISPSSRPGGKGRKLILRSLREFNRILTKGGYIEFVYFEKGLRNTGPLMEMMEPFFYSDIQCSPGAGRSAEGQHAKADAPLCMESDVSVETFLELLTEAGFDTNQTTVMMFPVHVLSALFTREGCRREDLASLGAGTREYADGKDAKALQLFEHIRSECVALGTGWRCAVGWARKGAAPGLA